ncbi:putative ribonuclease H-like domain-containing protein [Tanacetum coccineum]
MCCCSCRLKICRVSSVYIVFVYLAIPPDSNRIFESIVILNGDSPLLKKTIDGVEQTYPPTTEEEKLARKYKLKARGTLLMALLNKHQLKFNSYKSSKSLMEAIEKRFGGSANEAVKTAHGVSTVDSKTNASNLPNVDSLSNVVIYSLFASQRDVLKVAYGNADYESKEISQEDRNLGVNGTGTIGFDKTKMECYNCHIRGHFARECRAPKQQDNRNRETTRMAMPVVETTSIALVLQVLQVLQAQTLRNVGAYKAGLESVEARLDVYKKNEAVFKDNIKILKLDIMLIDNALTELRKKFEKAKKERDDLKLTLEKFENLSKNLSKLLEIQVSDKFKTGVGLDSQVFGSEVNDKYKTGEGYHAVPPLYTRNFMPLKPDLISDSEDENETQSKSKQRKPSFTKVEFVNSNEHVKSPRESVKKVGNNEQAKYPRKNSQSPRDCDFYEKKMFKKPVWNYPRRVNHQNSQRIIHPQPKGNFVPKAVLMKSDLKKLNTSKQNFSKAAVSVNTARPINIDFQKPIMNCAKSALNVFNRAHSHVRRPFNKFTTNKNSNYSEKINTVKGNVTTAGPKAIVSDNKGNEANVVKGSASWGNPQQELKDKGVIDSGCSRHMTGNRSYLTDYEEIDGGIIAFGGSTKGGKITGKGKIRNGKLDIEDVYFVKELKFNLFSVSQMCDKKNSVLFTDTECVVLSLDIKLTDESHVLLKVPRKDNMYSIDLKNVVPQGGLIYFFAKATPDESNLWHRRLGHVNFKTINKMVKGNLVRGRKHALSFIKPFGCPFIILNTIDHQGKFDGKADEGFFIGYSTNSKAFMVFNSRTRIIEKNLHVKFSEDTPNIAGSGPKWIFDIDALTQSMNYEPVIVGNQPNGNAGTKACNDAGEEEKKDAEHLENEDSEVLNIEEPRVNQERNTNVNNTNTINIISPTVNAVGIEDDVVDENIVYECDDDPNMPNLEEIVYSDDDEGIGAEADITNLDTNILVSLILTTRVHKDHPVEQIIGIYIQHLKPEGLEPKKVIQALTDLSWIEAMQDELLQNKKDERGIVIRNKARLVAHGYTQEEGIDYDEMDVKSAFLYGKTEEEVYILKPGMRLCLLIYWMMDFIEVFIKRIKGDILLVQVYVDDIIFGSTKKVLCTEFENLMHKKFQMSSMGKHTFFLGLQVTQKDNGIFISQDKYVDKILKKFSFSTVRIAGTPMETSKPLLKDAEAEDVDVHLYRSMIESLMYLTAFRPDIMFAVCACERFQVTLKISHRYAVKRIFRYLKGQPKLGLWYPKDSPFDLEAYTDNDYDGTSLDRKSTIGSLNETIIKEWKDRIERAATIASSLEAEQDSVGVNAGVSKLMLLSINLLLPVLVYAARHTLTAVRHKLMLPGITYYCWFWATAKAKTVNEERQIQALVDKKKVVITEKSIRSDLKLDDVEGTDCLPTATIFAELERMSAKTIAWNEFSSTMASAIISLKDMGEDSDAPTDSYSTPIITQPSSSKPQKKNSRRKQRKENGPTEPVTDEATNEAHVSTPFYDPPPSGDDKMQLTELMSLCTSLQEKVLDLEKAKTAQAKEIASLKKRVKLLEKRRKSRTSGLKRLKKVGSASRVESSNDVSLGAQEDATKQGRKIADIDVDAEVTLIDETQERNDEDLMFDTGVFEDPVSAATTISSIPVSAADPVTTVGEVVTTASAEILDELTLARTLIEIKSTKSKAVTTDATTVTLVRTRPKAKEVVIQEPSETTTTSAIPIPSKVQAKDKGKAKMVKREKPVTPQKNVKLLSHYAK